MPGALRVAVLTEQRSLIGVRLLIGTILAMSALFGVPQLFA